MPPTDQTVPIVLEGLGVPIAVSPVVARALQDAFPASDRDAVAHIDVDIDDHVEVVSTFTAIAVEHTELLGFHACVVTSPVGALVVPGRSGLGKSTLAAALTRAGFGYVSDEVCAVDRASGRFSAFPRPITLDNPSLAVLGMSSHSVDSSTSGEFAIDPRALGRIGPADGPLAAVVIAERNSGARAGVTIEEGSAALAASELIRACFNHYRWPRSALETITRIARTVPVLVAKYDEAPRLAQALAAHYDVPSD